MHHTTFAGLAMAGFAALAHANIATNGGFESGIGQDADAWNEIEIFGGTGGAVSSADRVSGSAYTGDWAMQFNVTGAPDFGPVAEIQQLTSNGSVPRFTRMTLSSVAGQFEYRAIWMPRRAKPAAIPA